jgi:hypothetical protein
MQATFARLGARGYQVESGERYGQADARGVCRNQFGAEPKVAVFNNGLRV